MDWIKSCLLLLTTKFAMVDVNYIFVLVQMRILDVSLTRLPKPDGGRANICSVYTVGHTSATCHRPAIPA